MDLKVFDNFKEIRHGDKLVIYFKCFLIHDYKRAPMCLRGVVNCKFSYNVNLLFSAVFIFFNVQAKYLEKARFNVTYSIINPTRPELRSSPSSLGGMPAFIVITILFGVLNSRRNIAVANSHLTNLL